MKDILEFNRDFSDRLLTSQEAADMLGVAVDTLANWRLQGKGPRWLRVHRLIRYWLSDLLKWLESDVSIDQARR